MADGVHGASSVHLLYHTCLFACLAVMVQGFGFAVELYIPISYTASYTHTYQNSTAFYLCCQTQVLPFIRTSKMIVR